MIESMTENQRYIQFSPNFDSGMISSLANYRVLQLISMHDTVTAFVINKMFICSKALEIEVWTFVSIKKVIWDQLLASRTENIIQK